MVAAEMVERPDPPTSLTIGVMSPVGVDTAIEMSTLWCLVDQRERREEREVRASPIGIFETHTFQKLTV